ncbi:unnamed protein product [Caenorhabditis sp. 36 PRJEB53466]|nr:unnamed protein product [Caenorhabditis sp. 36 PRJEB53466]
MVEYLTNEPYPFKNVKPSFMGGVLMLDPRETFEKYERRSPQPPNERREYLACEYRREPIQQEQSRFSTPIRDDARLACEYRRDLPPDRGQLACELRSRPTTTITTYLPENNKRKWPIGWIVCIAVCVPILIAIIIFAAVWLQEVGII